MPFARILVLTLFLIIALMGWSWLRSLRSPWVRDHRGPVGWLIAVLFLFFIFALFKLFLPKI